jgi:UDP-3-O-[3-hydroxymyristoyl] glucosamine N-acyltransferase
MVNIKEIIKYLEKRQIEHEYFGSNELNIHGFSVLDDIRDNTIIWVKNKDTLKDLEISNNKNLLIVTNSIEIGGLVNLNYLISKNSKELFFEVLNHYYKNEKDGSFISKKSVVETKDIGNNVKIGHNCYIGPQVKISDNVTIKNNVVMEGKVTIGRGTIISSGVIIGTDGYGYYKNKEGINIKVPHFGGVIIGQNVEIGANTCIDRGTLGDTKIGKNVKIDNLSHIAHNVIIEDNAIVFALTVIAGSVLLRENSYVAPSATIMNQLTIGRNSIVGLGAVVLKDVEDNVVVAGVPAKILRRLGEEER